MLNVKGQMFNIAGLAALGLIAGFYFTFAQANPFAVDFPVTELGNCADLNACRTYCDQPANFKACTDFAVKRGLVAKHDAPQVEHRVDKFTEIIQTGGGPGGCKSIAECQSFCSQPGNAEVCLEFAEDHNLMPPEALKQAKKAFKFFKERGKDLPCRSFEECRNFCSGPENVKQCVEFGRKAGFIERHEAEAVTKAAELMASGEAPGGCNTPESCQTYCSDSSHQEECFAFAEKAGFVKPGEADKFRRILVEGGPGGCKSHDECEVFCNQEANRETCFNFAKEHGFVKEEEIKHIKEGISHFRIGLEQAPPEVAECLKASVGPNLIEDIKAGKLVPGPEIGERVRACFESHVGRDVAPEENFRHAHPKAVTCLKEKLGDDFSKLRSGKLLPSPELGETIRACFESAPRLMPPTPADILKNAPPDIQACIKNILNPDELQRLAAAGEDRSAVTNVLKEKLRLCYEKFVPSRGESEEGFKMMHEGPGGCRTPEECMNYCGDHKEECVRFRPVPLPGPVSPPGAQLGCPFAECLANPAGEECRLKLFQLERFGAKERFPGCFAGGGESGFIPPVPFPRLAPSPILLDKTHICPAMPTVDSCPAGQVKFTAFSSPECGTYYGCRTGESGLLPHPIPGGFCTEDWRPVCGANGKTYSNACHAKIAGVVVSYSGECRPAESGLFPPKPEYCIQVIALAVDPITHICKQFPTPCDVPANWVKVSACPSATEPQPAPTTGTTISCPSVTAPQSCQQNPSSDLCRQDVQRFTATYPNCGFEKYYQYPTTTYQTSTYTYPNSGTYTYPTQ